MTTMTTRIWTGGEGRGRVMKKDDGMTTVVRDMGNIHAYLPAMMMGCTKKGHSHHPGVKSWQGGRSLSCRGRIVLGLLVVIIIIVVEGGGSGGRLTHRLRICGHFRCK
jgi:hypothetical protein